MYYVYFLKSLTNNKVYVGYTRKNVNERLSEHNVGSNQWTSANKPFTLVYYESYHCLKDTILREKFYKMGFGKKIKKILVEVITGA